MACLKITPSGRVGVFHQNQAAMVCRTNTVTTPRHTTSADGRGYPIGDLVGAFAPVRTTMLAVSTRMLTALG